jgi:hypothetical protein
MINIDKTRSNDDEGKENNEYASQLIEVVIGMPTLTPQRESRLTTLLES